MTAPLSSAAQAIFFAADGMEPQRYRAKALAAAIRALTDQVVPEYLCSISNPSPYGQGAADARHAVRSILLDIAAELEASA